MFKVIVHCIYSTTAIMISTLSHLIQLKFKPKIIHAKQLHISDKFNREN